MGERRGAYKVLVGKPEEKRPLGRPRRTWEDNIKKDLLETRSWVWAGLISLRIETGGRHV
jgi:type IV secretory pathway TrbF-like protein